jgi:transcriptional regulator with XRE-family HTH domain
VTTEAKLGPALRALRRRLNMTLNEVAVKTGVTASTLSKAERNRLSLTYDKLVQLSQGLNVDITVFFESDDSKVGHRSINREGEGRVIDTRGYHYIYLSAELLRKKIIPILVDVKAASLEEFGELIRHPGEEFIFVVQGTVVVHTELYSPTTLRKGESMYFNSGMGHAYIAHGKRACRVLSVCSAPAAALEALPAPSAAMSPGARKGQKG